MANKNIGFIGVGLMGHGMAKNLVEKGFPLRVLGHRNRAPVDDLIERGAQEAKDLNDLVSGADVLILCVTGSPQTGRRCIRATGSFPLRTSRAAPAGTAGTTSRTTSANKWRTTATR